MIDLDKAYVLRLKGEKRGYIFYEYLEGATMFSNEHYIEVGKMKHACEFETYEEALLTKTEQDTKDWFDIVCYREAEYDYYKGDVSLAHDIKVGGEV